MTERTAYEWQPIETAPKDGTRILVCKKRSGHPADIGQVRILKWRTDHWYGDIPATYFQDQDLIAWMPLPEPVVKP
jgi:hypothetical protein